jgi:hypothetical protein
MMTALSHDSAAAVKTIDAQVVLNKEMSSRLDEAQKQEKEKEAVKMAMKERAEQRAQAPAAAVAPAVAQIISSTE